MVAPKYQTQPVTQVTASPLQESRAEQIRRLRQDAEISTEQKIVEKLEASRLEDEKRRSERLFGNRLNETPQVEVQQAVYAAPVVSEKEAVVSQNEEQDIADIRSEIAQEVRAQLAVDQSAKYTQGASRSYVGALVGMGEYPDLAEVTSNYSTGFVVGTELTNRVVVEGSFMYSSHDVEKGYPFFDEMDQYNVAVAAKYKILPGKFSPVAGGLVSYTNRQYRARAADVFSNEAIDLPIEDQDTQSVDFGLIIGADLEVSKSFQIGADYRHFFNLTSRNDDTPYFDNGFGRINVEGEQYWFFNVSAKMMF